jgi:hypothetical protein
MIYRCNNELWLTKVVASSSAMFFVGVFGRIVLPAVVHLVLEAALAVSYCAS